MVGDHKLIELLQKIEEIFPDTDITLDVILNPSKAESRSKIIKFYNAMLNEFNYMTFDYDSQRFVVNELTSHSVSFDADEVDAHEIYHSVTSYNILMLQLRYLLSAIENSEESPFSLADLMCPTTQRFTRFANNLISYWSYSNANYNQISAVPEEIGDTQSELDAINIEIEETKQQIKAKTTRLYQSDMQHQEILQDIGTEEKKAHDFATILDGASEQITHVENTEMAEQRGKGDALQKELAQLESEIETVQGSLTKMSKFDGLKAQLDDYKCSEAERQEKAQTMQTRLEKLNSVIPTLTALVADADSLSQTEDTCLSARHSRDAMEEKVASKRAECAALSNSMQETSAKIHALQCKHEADMSKANRKWEIQQEEKCYLESKKSDLVREIQLMGERTTSLGAEAEKERAVLVELARIMDEHQAEAEAHKLSLMQTVKAKNDEIQNAWAKTVEQIYLAERKRDEVVKGVKHTE